MSKSSDNFDQKERGKATIALILGTSSAGKSTLIKEVQKQDRDQPKEKRLDWVEDGIDMEMDRYDLPGIHLSMIKDDPDYEALSKGSSLENLEVLIPIFNGKLKLENQEVTLTDGELQIPKEISKDSKYNEENITLLYQLTQKYHSGFRKEADKMPTLSQKMENIFERAIENSKKGIPSVLDLVPLGSHYDVVEGFNKYKDDNNFSCPSVIALAHCDIGQIVEHMDSRNASGNLKEVRNDFRPLSQYGEMYRAATPDDTRTVGEVTMNDILDAAKKYGANKGNIVLLEDSKDAQGLVKKLGISQDVTMDEVIKIATDIPHDIVLQTDPKQLKSLELEESKDQGSSQTISDIAKQLNSFATNNSQLPNKTHGAAKIIKSEVEQETKEGRSINQGKEESWASRILKQQEERGQDDRLR